LGGRDRRIAVQDQPGQKQKPYLGKNKKPKSKRTGIVAQVLEHLPSIHKVLSSISSTEKTKKTKQNKTKTTCANYSSLTDVLSPSHREDCLASHFYFKV
jgi:hypothetical protein